MNKKTCSKCGDEFPITSYYFEKRKESKDGFRNECKRCRNDRRRQIYNEKYKSENNRSWEEWEIDLLNNLYPTVSNKELSESYLLNRTPEQIVDFATKKLNLHKNSRAIKFHNKDGSTWGWSEEDDEYLISNYETESFSEMENFLHKKSPTIIARAIKLGLKKIRKYSKDEIEIIKKYYPEKENEWIIENFMQNRTRAEIVSLANYNGVKKNKSLFLKIKNRVALKNLESIPIMIGSDNPRWNGGSSNLRIYLRGHIKKWNKDSLNNYDNKCFISNKTEDLIVHHVYPFKDIFYEVINELNLEIHKDISKYTPLELRNMIDLINKKHYNYGYGIPLNRDVHIQFHKKYGFYDYTYEDLIEFKNTF